MSASFRHPSVLILALVLSLFGGTIFASAQTASQLDKHARKIQHKLTKYRQGSYLHLVLSNAPDTYGALGALSDASFTFTSAETNASTTYRYDEVDRVKTDKQTIGQGAEPIHIRHIVPIVITGAAIAAGALTYEAVH